MADEPGAGRGAARSTSSERIPIGRANAQLRVLAWLIDLIIASFASGLVAREFVTVPLNLWVSNLNQGSDADLYAGLASGYWITGWVTLAVTLGVTVAILVPSLRLLRATPGQRILGLMTVPDEGVGRLGTGRATFRILLVFGPWAAVESFNVYFAAGAGSFFPDSPSAAALTVIPWLIRAAALIWYAGLGYSIATSLHGPALHDRMSGAIVLQRKRL